MLLLTGCVHEAQSVGKSLKCADVMEVASASARAFDEPREVSVKQSAASAVMSGLGSLMTVTSNDDARGFVPAEGTQISSPGWRHYVGCGKSMVCFDGGTCLKVSDDELQTMALRTPALMARSLADQRGGCSRAYADRRGPLVWTLAICGKYLGCTATRGDHYGCANPDGNELVGPGKR